MSARRSLGSEEAGRLAQEALQPGGDAHGSCGLQLQYEDTTPETHHPGHLFRDSRLVGEVMKGVGAEQGVEVGRGEGQVLGRDLAHAHPRPCVHAREHLSGSVGHDQFGIEHRCDAGAQVPRTASQVEQPAARGDEGSQQPGEIAEVGSRPAAGGQLEKRRCPAEERHYNDRRRGRPPISAFPNG